jgi:nucleoid-associated protein YgaU
MEKLTIYPEIGEPIEARFNPERYTVNKSVQFAEIGIPGLDAPVVQFIRGQSEKITLELFFDTTEFGMVDDTKDVRELTLKVYELMRVNGDTHAPPRFVIEWGDGGKIFSFGTSISPWVVLESVSEELNLFSPQGVPLRSKLTCTFREAWTIDEQLQETPRHTSDRTKVRTLKRGQTLSHLAGVEYQDPGAWRLIADANALANPRRVPPGTRLLIPRATPEAR